MENQHTEQSEIPRLDLIQSMTSSDSLQRKLCLLAAEFKMEFKTEFGQRIFTSNEISTEGLEGSEIYVDNIPTDVHEDNLIPIFSQAGTIAETRLILEPTGASSGNLFIVYKRAKAAKRAIQRFHGFIIDDLTIGVYKSLNNCRRLYLSNIPLSYGSLELHEELNRSFHGVLSVTMQATDSKHMHGAFVEFQTHKFAEEALKVMWPSKMTLDGINIFVEWAKPSRTAISNNRNIYLNNVPAWASRDVLVKFIVSLTHRQNSIVNVVRKKGGDKAAVEFTTMEYAHQALNMLDGFNWSGNVLQASWFNNQPQDENNLQQFNDFYLTPKVETPNVVTPNVVPPNVVPPNVVTPQVFTPQVFTPQVFTPKVATPEEYSDSDGSELLAFVNDIVSKGIDALDEEVDINEMYKLPRKQKSSTPMPSTSRQHEATPEGANNFQWINDLSRNGNAVNPQIQNWPLNITESPTSNNDFNLNNQDLGAMYLATTESEFEMYTRYLKTFDKTILIQKLYNDTVVNQHLLNIVGKSKVFTPLEPKEYTLFGPTENDISEAVRNFFKNLRHPSADEFVDQSAEEFVGQPVDETVNQFVDESVDQLVHESVDQSVDESDDDSFVPQIVIRYINELDPDSDDTLTVDTEYTLETQYTRETGYTSGTEYTMRTASAHESEYTGDAESVVTVASSLCDYSQYVFDENLKSPPQ